jgi:hypothetical protein
MVQSYGVPVDKHEKWAQPSGMIENKANYVKQKGRKSI